jgi:hypothetical protein
VTSQALLAQSVSIWQFLPTPHAAHVPPPQSTSVSAPSFRLSAHWLETHVLFAALHALLAQLVSLAQATPTPQPEVQAWQAPAPLHVPPKAQDVPLGA